GVKREKGAIQWCRTTFIRQKHLLLTGALLTALLLLLFGICSQLPAPNLWKLLFLLFPLLICAWLLFRNRHVRSPGTLGDDMHIHRFWNRAAPERRDPQKPEAHGSGTSARGRSVHEDTSSPVRPELEPPSVTFADIAGIDAVRREVEELVQFLRAPEHSERVEARIPRGALLLGPPGTGKPLLAKAFPGE